MKSAGNYRLCVGRLVWLLAALISTSLFASSGDIRMGDTHEATFPLLQTKTGVYTNVTVTKKTKDWIFILHSQGVCNIKATDLSTETRIMLGYEAPAKTGAEAASSGSGKPIAEMARVKISEVKEFAKGW